ncbi:mannose-1-phosphate guanylyltransferase [Chryseobacterium manosquense]|uniref:Mannose-1-phosphate guanylyltransferase n=1 Tax=Chryseobacterium manosquense TaxID=2754694 RepID=A0A7H1DWF3_9FLAO|nr:sugar phosphate nucleotidyltransferase [Chryseobacterium manosquense]QNS41311.1 mannose-1-phosphate guanylyltransferase [Chryseobacterium manosquense]
MENLKIVILSGGVGSRLWPLSRKSRPKQYLDIFNGESLFGLALQRNIELSKDFIIVGNQDNHQLSKSELEKSSVSYQEIIEAVPRNTTAAIAFAAFAASEEDILLVTPSDHIIENVYAYHNSVKEAVALAEEGYIVTFGIKPTKPETGYGYIEANGEDVLSFREKPNKNTALSFLSAGNFLWNSGMFCFKASVLLQELRNFEPKIYETALLAWNNANDGRLNKEDMMAISSKSIDYAVMERSSKMKVVKGDFGWSDLGSFEALYDYFKRNGNIPDENGNMLIGSNKFIKFLGLNDTILIESQDALLVLNKENAQDVKKVYEDLAREDSELIR